MDERSTRMKRARALGAGPLSQHGLQPGRHAFGDHAVALGQGVTAGWVAVPSRIREFDADERESCALSIGRRRNGYWAAGAVNWIAWNEDDHSAKVSRPRPVGKTLIQGTKIRLNRGHAIKEVVLRSTGEFGQPREPK